MNRKTAINKGEEDGNGRGEREERKETIKKERKEGMLFNVCLCC